MVIAADDFGLSLQVNEAVEMAHREGILTAASLMVAAPASADAIERARRLPSLRVGLHLVTVDAWPILPPEQVPHLVDARGRLRGDLVRLGCLLAASSAARREMRAEIEAQFAAFAGSGLALDHVNAHKHFDLHPFVAGMVFDIGRRYGMRALRIPREHAPTLRRIEPGSRAGSGLAVRACAAWLEARARRRGLVTPDHMFGLAWSGAMTAARMNALLSGLPDGLVEIYMHPATGADFEGHAEGYAYRCELDALLDAGCAEALRRGRHRPGGYLDPVCPSG